MSHTGDKLEQRLRGVTLGGGDQERQFTAVTAGSPPVPRSSVGREADLGAGTQ